MLTLIRNMLRTKLAGLLFVLLIVAMGAWGATDVFSGNLGNNMAAAGNVKFSEAQLDQEVERELRAITDQGGRAISKAQAVEQGLVDQVYQRELFRTALVAYAGQLGARATDEAVKDVIRENDAFLDEGGGFNTDLYRARLRNIGFSPAMFQSFIERDLTISRLTRSAQSALQPAPSITKLQTLYSAEQRTASWFMLQESSLPDIEPVTDEDIDAFYQEQKEQLTNPPRRAISIIDLKVDDFLSQSEFSEEELRAYYDAVKMQQYTGPDTRTWTEFAFRSEAQAQAALGPIAGGNDGEGLDGLVSASERSGKRESMSNSELAEDVFAPDAARGSIFGPVQTGDFHTIIRLDSITPGETEPFENVRDEIVDTLSREQAVGLYYDSISQLDSLIGTGASLEEIGRQMETPVLSFAPVNRNGVMQNGRASSALRKNPDVLSRAFELAEGQRTPRIGQDEDAYIIRVDRTIEAFTPPLEELREDLRVRLTQQRQSEALMNAAQSIKQDIESGELTLSAAAEQYGATVESAGQPFPRQARQNSPLPQAFVSGVFSLKNEGDIQIAPTQNQDQVALIQLTSIEQPSEEELDAMTSVSTRQVRSQLASDLLDAFASDIQQAVKLEANPSALESYKARVNPDT
ncbi:SurA N-terminal domain-containing protein [Henriciella sp.]|uniref:SurA N-terminal domain-containing protein n=1 Tax=Henriciella sp. TaxID=1968823 RepID=UPI00261E8D9A|nr:SurA N-terminal domain-containing protein [Henriciella sp.]